MQNFSRQLLPLKSRAHSIPTTDPKAANRCLMRLPTLPHPDPLLLNFFFEKHRPRDFIFSFSSGTEAQIRPRFSTHEPPATARRCRRRLLHMFSLLLPQLGRPRLSIRASGRGATVARGGGGGARPWARHAARGAGVREGGIEWERPLGSRSRARRPCRHSCHSRPPRARGCGRGTAGQGAPHRGHAPGACASIPHAQVAGFSFMWFGTHGGGGRSRALSVGWSGCRSSSGGWAIAPAVRGYRHHSCSSKYR